MGDTRGSGGGYVRRIDYNLWRPLHSETHEELERGSGNELHGHGKRPAKMRAVHSSAALACNFFDFWRDRNKSVLTVALAVDSVITGLRGTPPQHRGGALLYLFYDDAGAEGARHREEVSVFTELLGGEMGFRALSYQQVFKGLQALDSGDGLAYIEYLRSRYFPA